MLSKEEVLEIISYCDAHGVQRKARLRELVHIPSEFSYKKYLNFLSLGFGLGQATSLRSLWLGFGCIGRGTSCEYVEVESLANLVYSK